MKLLRYGPAGREKPGLLDSNNRFAICPASSPTSPGRRLLPDVARSAAQTRSGDAAARRAARRESALRRPGRQVHLRRAELLGSRRRIRHGGAERADPLHEGHLLHRRPERRHRVCRAGRRRPTGKWSSASSSARPAKYVSEADALSHVAGYCVVHDVSERAYQLEGTGQWVKGKSADTFGPIGPWLVTTDEVPEPGQPGTVARRGRHPPPGRLDEDADLRRRRTWSATSAAS